MSDLPNGLVAFDYLAQILIRCFWYTVAVLILSWLIFLVAGDVAFRVHSALFGISKHEFVLMYYYGMAFMKMVAFLFFLFPYIAIKVVLKKHRK